MKQLICFLLVCATIGCTSSENKNVDDDESILNEEHATVDTTTVLQPSQLNFDEALSDIRSAKKAAASAILKKAVLQLNAEKENMKIPEVKEKMGYATKNILAVADSLEDDRNISISFLRKNISKAELLLARHYFINIEMPEAIDKTYVAIDKSIAFLEAGLNHNDDDSISADAGSLITDTKSLLQKSKSKKQEYKEELKKGSERVKRFLEKHTH